MSGIDLYYFPMSPPTRSVLMLARFLGITMNLKLVDIMKGEQFKEEFIQMNPQHSVPTLNDNGYVLYESRAILKYLLEEYSPDNDLKPNSVKESVMVDQRLYFDATTLFPTLFDYFFPVMTGTSKPDAAKASKFEEALDLLNKFLENKNWVANNKLSIADFAIVSTISTAEAVEFDISKYPNLNQWYINMKKTLSMFGYEEVNQKGTDMIAGVWKSKQ